MDSEELQYAQLKGKIEPIQARTGLPESAAFLAWFLENVYRLDETDARDAICDHSNDKGIDGIYVDHNNEEVHFLQAKIRQNSNGAVGDVGPKNLMASVQQFGTVFNVEEILAGNADGELKRLVVRIKLPEMIAAGYQLVGVYVSNELPNDDSVAYQALTPAVRIFHRNEIAVRVVDVDVSESRKDSFTFDTSYVDPMKMQVGSGSEATSMYVFPAKALQLVHMDGIADQSLFRANVRYKLGNTAVNKSIKRSVASANEHSNFVLFHNGITILCEHAESTEPGALTIHGYSVVNGAQSLTTFYNSKAKLSDDLRVLVRVVELQDEQLARTITENSNNQNAIKPRDLRSNHAIMVRLQQEMSDRGGPYFFEIKRGEVAPLGADVITNDEVGRALLAFDIQEPWSAHQIYKVFDEKYAEIFGRPEVSADRIVFIYRLVGTIQQAIPSVQNKPMSSYTLTRYFLLYILSRILRGHETSKALVSDPSLLDEAGLRKFLDTCLSILQTVVVDLNYEAKDVEFDYKSVLKSPKQSTELSNAILASYEKDVVRRKAESFDDWQASS